MELDEYSLPLASEVQPTQSQRQQYQELFRMKEPSTQQTPMDRRDHNEYWLRYPREPNPEYMSFPATWLI